MKREESERIEALKEAHLKELSELHDKYYRVFDDLQEAIPSLSPEAYEIAAENILEQYELEYRHFDEKYRTELELETLRLAARREILVPFRWSTGWGLFRKYKQNSSATLVDEQAYEDAKEFFAGIEAEIAEKRYRNAEESREEELEIEGVIDEESEEGEENISKTASVGDSDGEASRKDVEKAEVSAENAPESGFEGTEQAENVETESPSKGKRRARRKKEKKGEEENASVVDQGR